MNNLLHFTNGASYYLSEGQLKHFYYCLSRLGFQDEVIKTTFVEKLYEAVCKEFKNYKAESKDGKTGWIDYYPYGDKQFMNIVYNKVVNEVNFNKMNVANKEIMSEPIIHYVREKLQLHSISATDISSFVFCPASYCIRKSFTDLPISKETKEGIELHENHRLANYAKNKKGVYEVSGVVNNNKILDESNKLFFEDVRNSTLHYVGHDKNEKKYFKSSKGDFYGQPDYVFENSKGDKYIVEEKFRKLGNETKFIKNNHKTQIGSYIVGLDKIGAKYGYLVYWYYGYEENIRHIKKCVVFKVDRNNIDTHELRTLYKQITAINSGTTIDFIKEKINLSKCASCVVRKICGHKTGRHSELRIPYGKEYYGLV